MQDGKEMAAQIFPTKIIRDVSFKNFISLFTLSPSTVKLHHKKQIFVHLTKSLN